MTTTIFFDILTLLFLFITLAWFADVAVKNIKNIGALLKIRLFVFGILLGLITSLPELSLGINATIDDVATLSVGNLLGGIIVIFGLILGVSLLLNRKIITDGSLKSLLPTILVIFSAVFLGLDGKYAIFDGLVMIGLYVGLIVYLYILNIFNDKQNDIKSFNEKRPGKSILWIIVGIIGVLVTSHWIVETTLDLLSYIQVSKMVIGLIVFSIGTNLPEISIAITSWRKKSSELSFSHLLSSAFSNVLILGILSVLNPIFFQVNLVFWATSLFLILISVLLLIFYRSDKKLDGREGLILLSVYFIFMIVNIYLGFFID